VSAALDGYRAGIIGATRGAGERAALSFAREWADVGWDELDLLARSGRLFTADDLIAEVGSAPSPSAIGALFRQASRIGLIECVGTTTSVRISRHGGLTRLWVGSRWEA
jgi:NAD(P)-dependent dehydrogenase (short-subunit alcohol dehydrogenase family)